MGSDESAPEFEDFYRSALERFCSICTGGRRSEGSLLSLQVSPGCAAQKERGNPEEGERVSFGGKASSDGIGRGSVLLVSCLLGCLARSQAVCLRRLGWFDRGRGRPSGQ